MKRIIGYKKLNLGKLLEGRHWLWKGNIREAEVSSPWSDWADWGTGFIDIRSMSLSYSETRGPVLTPDFDKSDVIWIMKIIGYCHTCVGVKGNKKGQAYTWTTIGKFLMAFVRSRKKRYNWHRSRIVFTSWPRGIIWYIWRCMVFLYASHEYEKKQEKLGDQR